MVLVRLPRAEHQGAVRAAVGQRAREVFALYVVDHVMGGSTGITKTYLKA